MECDVYKGEDLGTNKKSYILERKNYSKTESSALLSLCILI